jgi:1-deoxy-D-xylulose-5-phosphate reductoisomerase
MTQHSKRRLAILGATGSIGRSTLAVVSANRDAFTIDALAAGSNAAGLAAAARKFGARFVAIADPTQYRALKEELAGTGIEAAAGEEAVIAAATGESDLVIAAIAGVAGLRSTFAAVQRGVSVAIANKESLVCAGAALMRTAAAAGTTILPMDSEHNALFQALGDTPRERIAELILTASGGPFRTWDAARIAAASPEQALAHPNWSMGAKVTIDSASLMNKGLELIEAHHLFGVPAERLGVLVHPQSIVHGLVRFRDGALLAGLAPHDMRVPIAHCLGFPDRIASGAAPLDLATIATLQFEQPDLERFPALALASEALRTGGAAPTVLNAANEVAVAAFLDRRIGFGHIAAVVEATLERAAGQVAMEEPADIDEALAVDHVSRKLAAEAVVGRLSLAR